MRHNPKVGQPENGLLVNRLCLLLLFTTRPWTCNFSFPNFHSCRSVMLPGMHLLPLEFSFFFTSPRKQTFWWSPSPEKCTQNHGIHQILFANIYQTESLSPGTVWYFLRYVFKFSRLSTTSFHITELWRVIIVDINKIYLLIVITLGKSH